MPESTAFRKKHAHSAALAKMAGVVAFGLLSLLMAEKSRAADEFTEQFDDAKTCCQVQFDPRQVTLKTHERTSSLTFSGQGAERLQFVSTQNEVPILISCPVQPARVFDDLRLSLSVYCNRPGTQLAVRVVFPHQIDPSTGKPLTRIVTGESLERPGLWQKLFCETSDKTIAEHLILWRAALRPQEIDSRGMYIDQVLLKQIIGRGMTEVIVDELRVWPIVSAGDEELPAEEMLTTSRPKHRIDFNLDHLEVDGRPVFPRVVPYQKEPVELFKKLGANVVWVDNYLNRPLIDELQQNQLWATAWPPSAKSDRGEILRAGEASLVPFGQETDGILFWNLGVRIPPENHQQLRNWVHQVKTSDRERSRPIMADVTGAERIFSRDLDLLGVSKHVLQTSHSFSAYSAHMQQRRRQAQPGTFLFSWLQTEPAQEIAQARAASRLDPAVIEPEQIRLQTYAALCAGCKGLGFWNWSPLDAAEPWAQERRLILEQMMIELKLLEPFLASGEVVRRFETPLTSARANSTTENAAANPHPHPWNTSEKISAAVVQGDHGLLILLTGTEPYSQLVPSQLAAFNLRVMVKSLPESAFIWEVTPTGLQPLESVRKAGGTEIRIPRFNLNTVLMVATDQSVKERMGRQIQRTEARSAELALQISESKLKRVEAVDEELNGLGAGLSEAKQYLQQARRQLNDASLAFQQHQYHQTRIHAEASAQSLRLLQRLYWHQAVKNLSSATSCPHTICFQTLPDYWKLVRQMGQGNSEHRLEMQSGQFEDDNAMLLEGWKRNIASTEEMTTYDALDPNAKEGEYCLRFAAIPQTPGQMVSIDEPAVTYRSPTISVHAGEMVHVTGWIKVRRPPTESMEGVLIYDSHYGPSTGLHWSHSTEWERFELLRPIWKQGDWQLILQLDGLGDVSFDDLQVKVVRLNTYEQEQPQTSELPAEEKAGSSKAMQLLNRLLK